MGTMLATKDVALDRATDAWQVDQQLLQETRLEVARLGDALKREADSKHRIETMLKSYKDEIETLNEALKIAALDIASAAGDQLLSDDDSDQDGDTAKRAAAAPARPTRTVLVNADGSYSVQSN
jgi:septal ring factor EnvC (AmiA/AmiB activator)